MCLDIARALSFMHRQRPVILHLDLKSLNVLVSEDWFEKYKYFVFLKKEM